MNYLYLLVASVPANESTSSYNPVSQSGPGFLGFVFTALLAATAIFLIRDMVRRVRRVRYTSEAESRQERLVTRGQSRPLQESEDEIDPKTREDRP
ncbi:hypothetical protein OK351_06135 [Glutamicibacter sp. MNS18]|uniref:hypothetical protein n=1 Tax=Glutamicibacter sp. MNS18 TaxID=2989817 RepID=UPI002235E9EE|nr:hypothetical protein [Glutamicibacter sp. MNS18]MCW4465081.1 hypothetical protein [Glutamicibacter sp. MNS18]